MGIFDLFKKTDINQGVTEFQKDSNAVLIDVREKSEFRDGHIPRAINVPISNLKKINSVVKDKDTPIYVYCLSGSRSYRAASIMSSMGYTKVKNIGGIHSYKGVIQR